MTHYYLALALAVLCTVAAQLLMKKGASRATGGGFLAAYLNWPTAIAFALFFAATILNVFAYKKLPLKTSVAVLPANFILVGLLSVVFLKERLNAKQIAGVTVILAGILLYAGG
jgi:multidrug transporter EmrE-like cation transporter